MYLVPNYNALSAEYSQTRMGHNKSFDSFVNTINRIINKLLRHYAREYRPASTRKKTGIKDEATGQIDTQTVNDPKN